LTAVSKSKKEQEDVAKQLSQQICKAFPKDEAVSSSHGFNSTVCAHVLYVVQVTRHSLQKMLVTFRQDATLIFGGNTEPAALAELYYAAGGQPRHIRKLVKLSDATVIRAMSGAGFGHDIHTKLTKLIQSILQETLGVSPGRCHCVVSSLMSRVFEELALRMLSLSSSSINKLYRAAQ